jgi:hypothetical protein
VTRRKPKTPDAQAEADAAAYIASVLEAWRKRPFLVSGAGVEGDAKQNQNVEGEPSATTTYVVEVWPFTVNRAKDAAERLNGLGFRAYLDLNGSLLIADDTGMGRDLDRFLLTADIANTFDALVAGLAEDPGLLGLYQPKPQRSRQRRLSARVATPPRREAEADPIKSVRPYPCVHCGSSKDETGNPMLKVAYVGPSERAFVHVRCWADWRAKQTGEPAPEAGNAEGSNEEDEASSDGEAPR